MLEPQPSCNLRDVNFLGVSHRAVLVLGSMLARRRGMEVMVGYGSCWEILVARMRCLTWRILALCERLSCLGSRTFMGLWCHCKWTREVLLGPSQVEKRLC